jgi:type IV pilus assembly protein PilM
VVGEHFPSTLVLSIGATSTSLAIVQNGNIQFTYATPTGGVAISRAIASSFGFSFEQAEAYKKTYGLSEQNFGGKIAQSVQPILSLILSEVKKALAFYQEKQKDTPIAQIVLSGGSAKLPGLATYLTSAVGVETVIANPWKILVSQEISKDILEDAASYSIAVGLAMR